MPNKLVENKYRFHNLDQSSEHLKGQLKPSFGKVFNPNPSGLITFESSNFSCLTTPTELQSSVDGVIVSQLNTGKKGK